MKFILPLFLLAALLLSGCMMQTVEDMYCLPKRSEDHDHLQLAIDAAMVDLQYAAPLSGENRQSLQMADLDGDGVSEYLVFAKSNSDAPLRILIFHHTGEAYTLKTSLTSQGMAFDRVEYVDINGDGGLELVVGTRLSDQVLGHATVYSLVDEEVELLLSANYGQFLTCDLNCDRRSELVILSPGEADSSRGVALLYSWTNDRMERSTEVELSGAIEHIKRIMVGKLHGETPAVYVASSADGNAIITDIFAMKSGQFTNISFSNESGTSVRTLRNYYVYADDVDDDGILELPSLITMASTQNEGKEDQYLIRWFAMDLKGREVDKQYTFHNFAGGWYVCLDNAWATQLSVEQCDDTYRFFVWDAEQQQNVPIFTVFALTGQTRDTDAVEDGRFVLHRTDRVVYAALLEGDAAVYGITQENLMNNFRLIQRDWNTGET
jgi:hypothetical protein